MQIIIEEIGTAFASLWKFDNRDDTLLLQFIGFFWLSGVWRIDYTQKFFLQILRQKCKTFNSGLDAKFGIEYRQNHDANLADERKQKPFSFWRQSESWCKLVKKTVNQNICDHKAKISDWDEDGRKQDYFHSEKTRFILETNQE